MSTEHVEELLVPYLRDELAAAERERVAAHLEGCPPCRATRDAHRALLAELAAAPEPAPSVHWGAYRAELRQRLDRRRPSGRRRRWWTPVPVALAAGLAAVLVYVALPAGRAGREEPGPADQALLASRLDLLRRFELVERLDLLEDYEVISRLDSLPGRG
jgi:anti-sigma factor RsiW